MRGNLLLINYRFDLIGWLIKLFTHSKFNHVVWVINDKIILEVKGRGIILAPYTKYYNKLWYNTSEITLTNITKSNLNKALNLAIKQISKKKRSMLWLTFMYMLLRLKKKKPRLTCSGFVAFYLAKVGYYFNKNKLPENITPEDIYRNCH